MHSQEKTNLERKFAFWYRISDDALLGTKPLNQNEYENQVKRIAEFETVNILDLSFYLGRRFLGYFSTSKKA